MQRWRTPDSGAEKRCFLGECLGKAAKMQLVEEREVLHMGAEAGDGAVGDAAEGL